MSTAQWNAFMGGQVVIVWCLACLPPRRPWFLENTAIGFSVPTSILEIILSMYESYLRFKRFWLNKLSKPYNLKRNPVLNYFLQSCIASQQIRFYGHKLLAYLPIYGPYLLTVSGMAPTC